MVYSLMSGRLERMNCYVITMENKMKFNAILTNWSIDEDLRIHGDCYADGRPVGFSSGFARGERISTSPVQFVERTPDGPVAVTRSGTRYLLA